jgi:hypothetical protein
MFVITKFMPRWIAWIDATFPFIHVRRGRRTEYHVGAPGKLDEEKWEYRR